MLSIAALLLATSTAGEATVALAVDAQSPAIVDATGREIAEALSYRPLPEPDRSAAAAEQLRGISRECGSDFGCFRDRMAARSISLAILVQVVMRESGPLAILTVVDQSGGLLTGFARSLPEEAIPTTLRAEIDRTLDRAKLPRLSRLEVELSPADADVRLISVPDGVERIPPSHVMRGPAGRWEIEIARSGFETRRETVVLLAGRTQVLRVSLSTETSVWSGPWPWLGIAAAAAVGAGVSIAILSASEPCGCLDTDGACSDLRCR